MPTISYEEACKLASNLTSAETIVTLGPDETIKRCRQRLAEVGWTISALTDEARRRMHARVVAMQDESDETRTAAWSPSQTDEQAPATQR